MPAGTGLSLFDSEALTFASGDPTGDPDGFFLYVRDLESRAFWSAGRQPVPRVPDRYEVDRPAGGFVLLRVDAGIETRTEIRMAPHAPAEIRRVRLRNLSERVRLCELTSYVEVVLHDVDAHASHLAFSKLFIQTECAASPFALLARRRPRGPAEAHPWMVHAMSAPSPEYETDRARFLGRGRGKDDPRALHSSERLSGTTGNVLDPILSLRRAFSLGPGEQVECAFLLGAAATREEALGLARLVTEETRATAGTPVKATTIRGEAAVQAQSEAPTEATPVGADQAGTPLLFFNGFGGFSPDGAEYVIRLDGTTRPVPHLPPRPWVNVVANAGFGFLTSETGAGCTWSGNSRLHRLTPWYNDPLMDPHGEALYLRDEESGAVWSPLPGPVPVSPGDTWRCETRHGFGYTAFQVTSHGLEHETVVFVAPHDPVKLLRLRLRAGGGRPRRLSLFAYQRWVLGDLPEITGLSITTEILARDPQAAGRSVVLARNPAAEGWEESVAFSAAVVPGAAGECVASADRLAFLGPLGSAQRPALVLSGGSLQERSGAGLDPCAAHQVPLLLEPGETTEAWFLLGEGRSRAEALALLRRFGSPEEGERAWREVRDFWSEERSALQVRTPVPALDLMVNGWLGYQTLSCRMWGRTALYQSGGAFGFRDQLQDSAAWLCTHPERTRAQLLLHAAHQFVEGDVLHWWNPPRDRGPRTRFADDLLWLPYVTALYVNVTGDWGVLDERAPFLSAPSLEDGEDERHLEPEPSGESGDLFEHCCRALDRSLSVGTGSHGLPLFGTGDWNDGMNRVGREGRGESVWMAFFLVAVLEAFAPICRKRGDSARARRYEEARAGMIEAANDGGWDGAWYRRGYYDDGTPLGSKESGECRIDALVQAWSVLSRAAPPERREKAMDAVEEALIDEEAGLIRLLTPPFEETPQDPGYIKGYVRGVRENGGQYTHAALWVVRALAELGRRDRAARLLEMLSPVSHAASEEQVRRYQVEPYVVAADVYGEPPHVGRGGWTWYTGSSAWMYRVALESILGFLLEGGSTIVLRPCIPDEWPEFSIDFLLPSAAGSVEGRTRYEILVRNPQRRSENVRSATLDGAPALVEEGAARIPVLRDGRAHRVEVTLG